MAGKEMAVEKIYQKKSQLEHILLRPDTYIGSIELLQQEMWIWDFENEKMIKKEISFVPGLYKIYDEILVNAADNKQRDKNMSLIRVNIDKENNSIKIYNNGRGIPVVEHKDEKVLVPTLIFGHLLTSSNYNDDEKKVTGGRNGYGAKLCNIFSKKFVLETSTKEYKKSFKQVWTNNMSKAEEPILKDAKEEDFTSITFVPDLERFKMEKLDDDTIALLARRAYDIAASTPGVKVYLNDKKLPVNKFEDYCKLYLSNELDEQGNQLKLISEKPNERWEVAIACSDIGFQQVSFVNSIATTKGGRHVDYVVDQVVKNLSEAVNKKNKNGATVKPFQIKNHMWIFINCLIENPTFDSQTKENMTLQSKSFGSKCTLSEDFFKKLTKSGLLERIMNWLAYKEKTDLEKAGAKSKHGKIKGIPKLDDANDAGSKDSINCTLIVTEGDSAKTLAVAGLGVIGRDKYGVFPLRGKMLNVREASVKQILENSEVSSLLKIIGLNFKEKYETKDSLKQLRYGKLMIMTDQDHDGSHIKGLIINFVHYQWPNLLKHGFVEEFITPIVKVSKGNQEKSFYSMPEFEEWQNQVDNWNTWKIKYYKGLGTSTSKEAKEYFSDMSRHRIKFGYASRRDDLAIQLAFSKKFIDERKDWLTRYMDGRKQRREEHLNEDYLYQKNTKEITFTDFVNKELVLFSNLDNERSIPCLVDGFKPGQRKVLFSCFKRNLVKELKVAQLAGSVAELSAYHHGEASLMSTIINLAQNYVGSNNINLLQPIGQFGTRLHGGKDSASPRYIFTCLSPLTRLLFNQKDDPLFSYIDDDGFKVEPEWYCPIIPTVLINGSEGIGTGWSTKIPNYNPRELISNIRLMIDGQPPKLMKPFYKNFRGQIDQIDDLRVQTSGVVAILDDTSIEITELPISVWTQSYKESVLEPMLHGSDNKTPPSIVDYREYHTDTTVRFVVKMTPEQFNEARKAGFHKFFKLTKTLSLNSMVLFDNNGCLKRYETVNQILKEFFVIRSELYTKRKAYLEGMLGAESLKLDNIARFILEKIEGKIKVENLKKADICKMLKDRKYDPDPVLKWKETIAKDNTFEPNDLNTNRDDGESNENEPGPSSKNDYDYLLGMPIWNLTMEKKDEILKQQKTKQDELNSLKKKTPHQLWIDDLDQFSTEFDKFEAKEKEDESVSQLKAFKASKSGAFSKAGTSKKAPGKGLNKLDLEYLPSADAELVEPVIDQALKDKGAREVLNKEAKAKKETNTEINMVDIITSKPEQIKEEDIVSFAERLLKPAKTIKAEATKKTNSEKKPKVKDEDVVGDDDEEDQVVSTTSKKKPTTSKKATGVSIDKFFKKKSKATSSDESESMCVELDTSETNLATNNKPQVRERKTAVKYNDDNDNESSDDEIGKKAVKKKAFSDSEQSIIISDDEDDDFETKPNKKPVAKKPKKTQDENESKPVENNVLKKTTSKTTLIKKTTSKSALKPIENVDIEIQEATDNKAKNSKASSKDEKKTSTKAATQKEANGNIVDFFNKNKAKPKSKKIESDEDSFVVNETSDEEEYASSSKKASKETGVKKKQLMSKIDNNKKKAKKIIVSDDDIESID